jgi:hypothetical protein
MERMNADECGETIDWTSPETASSVSRFHSIMRAVFFTAAP